MAFAPDTSSGSAARLVIQYHAAYEAALDAEIVQTQTDLADAVTDLQGKINTLYANDQLKETVFNAAKAAFEANDSAFATQVGDALLEKIDKNNEEREAIRALVKYVYAISERQNMFAADGSEITFDYAGKADVDTALPVLAAVDFGLDSSTGVNAPVTSAEGDFNPADPNAST